MFTEDEMTEKRDRNFFEMFGEGFEAALDLAIDNEAIKAVPIVGTAFKLLKGIDDIRSRVLVSKLHRFLSEPSLRAAMEARTIRDEILNTPGRDQEIGETLFLTLEKVTDMTKPVLLANAYASYISGDIEPLTFEAIAHAIDVSFLRDLLQFLERDALSCDEVCLERLAAVGLIRVSDQTWNNSNMYGVTSLGMSLKTAVILAQTGRRPTVF